MGMIYKRGEIFWIKYYSSANPIRESSHSSKESDAKRLLRDREGRVEMGAPILPRVERVPVEELLADLKALVSVQIQQAKHLSRKLGRVLPHLFVHLRGCYKGQPVHDFRKAWSQACDKVGLVGMLRHGFRRSAVRNMEGAGVPRSVAMKISGHKTESIYRRYAIVSESDIQDATRRLLSRAQNGHTSTSSVDSAHVSG